jgi:hypothetical protein
MLLAIAPAYSLMPARTTGQDGAVEWQWPPGPLARPEACELSAAEAGQWADITGRLGRDLYGTGTDA